MSLEGRLIGSSPFPEVRRAVPCIVDGGSVHGNAYLDLFVLWLSAQHLTRGRVGFPFVEISSVGIQYTGALTVSRQRNFRA
jgi:hypothetical protein